MLLQAPIYLDDDAEVVKIHVTREAGNCILNVNAVFMGLVLSFCYKKVRKNSVNLCTLP
jgi:hypothetical protein